MTKFLLGLCIGLCAATSLVIFNNNKNSKYCDLLDDGSSKTFCKAITSTDKNQCLLLDKLDERIVCSRFITYGLTN